MLGFIGKRLLMAIPTLIGVSLVIFATIKIIPGDPVAAMLGPTGTPEAKAVLSERLGLNDPLPVQYWSWLTSTLTGDFGSSLAKRTAVAPIVMDALGDTLVLTLAAAIMALVLGLFIGTITALRENGIVARIGNAFALFSISVPQYSVRGFNTSIALDDRPDRLWQTDSREAANKVTYRSGSESLGTL